MGITITWGNVDKTIIVMSHTEPWTWEEFREAGGEVVVLLDSVQHKVGLIDDLKHNAFMPSVGFVDNLKWAVLAYHTHANMDAIAIVLDKSIRELFVSAIRLYGAPNRAYLIANSVDHAYRLLAERLRR